MFKWILRLKFYVVLFIKGINVRVVVYNKNFIVVDI